MYMHIDCFLSPGKYNVVKCDLDGNTLCSLLNSQSSNLGGRKKSPPPPVWNTAQYHELAGLLPEKTPWHNYL